MPENRQVQSNGGLSSSSNSSDKIEEAIWRLKIQTNDDQESNVASNLYPDRPGAPDCIYFLRTGLCGYGKNCRFNHPPAYPGQGGQYRDELPERLGQQECGFFLKTGTCKYGSTCKYHHPRDRHRAGSVALNSLGLPIRQEEKSCPYYLRTGLCKFGALCKFHHPQPASAEAVLPAAYGSTGSTVAPSSGLSYVGGLPAWSLPRAPYIYDPAIQGPTTYIPFVLSPSQGTAPTQGWSTYVGDPSAVSSSGVLGSNPVYNANNQGDSSTRDQLHVLSTLNPSLPERPDQPECRYFMNNGSCKYGSDCKYHHPRERIVQVASNSLGPLGLPLRPGQAVCSYYSLYGLCKYGPTCKYDHPLTGYSYNYGLSSPALPMLHPSFFPFQRNLPLYSSELSPAKSSQFSDWLQKPEAPINKSLKANAKIHEVASEQDASPPHSLRASPPGSPDNQSD